MSRFAAFVAATSILAALVLYAPHSAIPRSVSYAIHLGVNPTLEYIADAVSSTISFYMAGQQKTVVVVGGGLAGLSSALEAASDPGTRVILVEKEAKLGGNSAKASSGINAAGSSVQAEQGVEDSTLEFFKDTMKSGQKAAVPELVTVLSEESAAAIEFLKSYGVDLSVITQLGGHSSKRTHRSAPKPDGRPVNVGFSIMQVLRGVVEEHPDIEVRTGLKMVDLVLKGFGPDVSATPGPDQSPVAGIYVVPADNLAADATKILGDAVIVTTGGYGADREGRDSLLQKYRPDLVHLATTNGAWATGDGVKVVHGAIGADLWGMEYVQVHPTGFVDPNNPNAGSRFLAPEALRGVGGVLINSKGERFVNELGLRDHVTNTIWDQKDRFGNTEDGPLVARLILNDAGVEAFNTMMIGFYKSKNLFTVYEDGVEGLAKDMGVSVDTLTKTLEDYNSYAQGTAKDPFGKVVFPDARPQPKERLTVAVIAPVIHYTMGGLRIDSLTRVLKDGYRYPGLYAAGEASGGVHGKNRLGGNSLLECVVFGRRAGKAAAGLGINKYPTLRDN